MLVESRGLRFAWGFGALPDPDTRRRMVEFMSSL